MSLYSNRPRRKAGSLALWSFTALTFIGLAVLPTGYVIERPGQSFNVMAEVGDKPVISSGDLEAYKSESSLDILTVSILGNRSFTPNWLQVLGAWIDPQQIVKPLDEVYPPQFTQEQIKAESSLQMEVSQQEAIAAALKNLGYEFAGQLYVNSVIADAPASKILIAGDFVQKVNGVTVLDFDSLRAEIQKSEGNPVVFQIEREGKTMEVSITPKLQEGSWVIGAMVGTVYDFPVAIDLQLGDVGGPSGGMMFTLGIIDTFTPGSIAGSNHVAGTGTISNEGIVGPIGGIELKMLAAKNSGADLFIGPFDNCSEMQGNVPSGLNVVAVKTLEEALQAVSDLEQGKKSPNLTCDR